MKKAAFKATALLLSFLLVLQISPITAWAEELNSFPEAASSQVTSSGTGSSSSPVSQRFFRVPGDVFLRGSIVCGGIKRFRNLFRDRAGSFFFGNIRTSSLWFRDGIFKAGGGKHPGISGGNCRFGFSDQRQ